MKKSLVVLGSLLVSAGCDQVFGLSERDAGANGDAKTDADSGRHIRYIQSKSGFLNGVSSLSLTFDQAVVAGDLVVVAVGTFEANLSSVTDSAGNQYREPITVPPTAANGILHVLYAPNVLTASPFTITATANATGAPELTMAIHAYRGAEAEPIDQSSFNTGGPDLSPTTGTVTTTLGGELYFGALSHDNTVTTTAGTGFTLREVPTENNMNMPLATEDMIGPARSKVAATFMLDSTATWACALLTFK